MKILKVLMRLFYRRLDGQQVAEGGGMPWWMGMMWSSVDQVEVEGSTQTRVVVYVLAIPLNLPVRWVRRLVLWVKYGVTPWAN